jgi:hypothetical protein
VAVRIAALLVALLFKRLDTPELRPKKPLSIFYRGSALVAHRESVVKQFVPDAAGSDKILPGEKVGIRLENPCVGGSIPPRATKNIPHQTPTHAGWRFRFVGSQSSRPVYFRCHVRWAHTNAPRASTLDWRLNSSVRIGNPPAKRARLEVEFST